MKELKSYLKCNWTLIGVLEEHKCKRNNCSSSAPFKQFFVSKNVCYPIFSIFKILNTKLPSYCSFIWLLNIVTSQFHTSQKNITLVMQSIPHKSVLNASFCTTNFNFAEKTTSNQQTYTNIYWWHQKRENTERNAQSSHSLCYSEIVSPFSPLWFSA